MVPRVAMAPVQRMLLPPDGREGMRPQWLLPARALEAEAV
jgi:hypothetical protein